MKIWSNYLKELKIASRGFYFYIELVVALILLAGLILVVPTDHSTIKKEVIFPNCSKEKWKEMVNLKERQGHMDREKDEVFKVKPTTLTYTCQESKKKITKQYKDKKEIKAQTYFYYDPMTGKHTKTKYIVHSFDDMLRIAYSKKYIGTEMWYGKDGMDYYHNVLFGYETSRYQNIVKASHGTVDMKKLVEHMDQTKDNTIVLKDSQMLNNRQQYVPLLIVLMNSLLAIMVIIAFISTDKSEGLIKAMSVSPFSMSGYLISKIMVALTTTVLSSLIIAIPIIGRQMHFIMFLFALLSVSILACVLGILFSTFFKDLTSSFGAILVVAIVMMIPAISYLMPSFHPSWIEWFPTYHMLEIMKETMLVTCDIPYVTMVSCSMLVVSGLLFVICTKRYRKILGA